MLAPNAHGDVQRTLVNCMCMEVHERQVERFIWYGFCRTATTTCTILIAKSYEFFAAFCRCELIDADITNYLSTDERKSVQRTVLSKTAIPNSISVDCAELLVELQVRWHVAFVPLSHVICRRHRTLVRRHSHFDWICRWKFSGKYFEAITLLMNLIGEHSLEFGCSEMPGKISN